MRTTRPASLSLLLALLAIVAGAAPPAMARAQITSSGAPVIAPADARRTPQAQTPQPPAVQASCIPSIALGSNLIANGDAEADSGAPNENVAVTPSCWTTTPSFSAIQYGVNGFPAPIAGGGANFFGGGPDAATSTAMQAIDVSSLAASIDGGDLYASLSGLIGGYDGQGDTMVVAADFRAASQQSLGQASIGPMTIVERNGFSILLPRATTARLPIGTRRIIVTMTATRPGLFYNDGYADNLALVLTACGRSVALDHNLIVNGDGETTAGARDDAGSAPVVCWATTPNFTTVRYGASGASGLFPQPNALPDGGASFFGGGPHTTSSFATQVIDVTSLANAIDAGVHAILSGYLGGYADHRDSMVVRAEFRSASQEILGQLAIGPVTATDRGNTSMLLPRSVTASLPPGTRRIVVTMTAARQDGFYDDGYADNLSLILSSGSATITPLILIPGIMGSKLYNTHDHKEIWETGAQQRDVSSLWQLQDITSHDIIPTYMLYPYDKLHAMLTGAGGYREYPPDFTETPLERCQRAKREGRNDITLFVFAYDWRQDNDANADELRTYVDCIRSIHPGSQVNILTHSMGGLLARRYILKYADHHVGKLVTIAAPWLGAPKAINALETGDVLDLHDWWAPAANGVLKNFISKLASAPQLLPSRGYYTVGERPFAEQGWDVNGNHDPVEPYDRYEDLVAMLDYRHTNTPGTANQRFHDADGQDDWNGQGRGVQYYHIVGTEKGDHTIGKVRAVEKQACGRRRGVPVCYVIYQKFELDLTTGDGTVPITSAVRMGDGHNLNDPAATLWEVSEQHGDGTAEHTGLTTNPHVHACILFALQSRGACALGAPQNANVQSQSATPTQTRPPALPAYYLDVSGVRGVTVADMLGNTTHTISGTVSTLVPDVTFYGLSDAAYLFIFPTDQTYTVTLHTGIDPLLIDLRKGTGDTTSQAMRYLDLELPPNVDAIMKITPQGAQDLRYDADGNGTFETSVAPTAAVSGVAASDVEPPMVTVNKTGSLANTTVTLATQDSGSGVKTLVYSLDGVNFLPYIGPILVNALQTPTLYAFADDNVANRSSLVTIQLAQQIHLPHVRR